MKKRRQLWVIILVVCTLCGCSKASSQVNEKQDDIIMGRYIGQKINLPPLESENAEYEGMHVLKSGEIICNTSENTLFVSKDGGRTWKEKQEEKFNQIEGRHTWLAMSKTGEILLDNFYLDETTQKEKRQIIYIDARGNRKELPLTKEEEAGFETMDFLQDGTLIGTTADGTFYSIDKETGEQNKLFTCWPGSYKYGYNITTDYIIAVGEEKEMHAYNAQIKRQVYLYSLNKKEAQRDASVFRDFLRKEGSIREKTTNAPVILIEDAKESGVIYFATQSGLFRHVIGGNLIEQLIDGKQTEFGNPNNEMLGMSVRDNGEFLVLYSNNRLIRYTFSKEVPTV